MLKLRRAIPHATGLIVPLSALVSLAAIAPPASGPAQERQQQVDSQEQADKGERREPAEAAGTVRPVESSLVCMVQNKVFETEQIPVSVEGRTYRGCCEMCKKILELDPTSRSATDPVSGNAVDKAVAVIGAKSDGSVLYFESAATLEKYNAARSQAQ